MSVMPKPKTIREIQEEALRTIVDSKTRLSVEDVTKAMSDSLLRGGEAPPVFSGLEELLKSKEATQDFNLLTLLDDFGVSKSSLHVQLDAKAIDTLRRMMPRLEHDHVIQFTQERNQSNDWFIRIYTKSKKRLLITIEGINCDHIKNHPIPEDTSKQDTILEELKRL